MTREEFHHRAMRTINKYVQEQLKLARERVDRLEGLAAGRLVAKVVPVGRHWVDGHYVRKHTRTIAVKPEKSVATRAKLQVLRGGAA